MLVRWMDMAGSVAKTLLRAPAGKEEYTETNDRAFFVGDRTHELAATLDTAGRDLRGDDGRLAGFAGAKRHRFRRQVRREHRLARHEASSEWRRRALQVRGEGLRCGLVPAAQGRHDR